LRSPKVAKKSSGPKRAPKSGVEAKKLGGKETPHSEEVVRVLIHKGGLVAKLLAQEKQKTQSSTDGLDFIAFLAEIVKSKGTYKIRVEFVITDQERAVLGTTSTSVTMWTKGC
jgi:hypothetical protein